MRFQTRKLQALSCRPIVAVGAVVVFILTLGLGLYVPSRQAAAATSSYVNFQARLMTAAGAIAADGDYNVEFKLYNALTSSGSSQGSCTGDSACLWTETRTSTNKIHVANGYISASLGSVTSFPSTINWSQQLYLTMNIGGTGSPTWDGEMTPRLVLTATPYAFAANTLAATSGSNSSSLVFATPANPNTVITLPNPTTGSTASVCYQTDTACGFVAGSATNFIQNGVTQQTANFNVIGGATGSPTALIQGVASGTKPVLQLRAATTSGAGEDIFSVQDSGGSNTFFKIDSTGKTTTTKGVDINDPGDATALTVENAAGTFLTVDTSISKVSIGGTCGVNTGRLCVTTSLGGVGAGTYVSNSNILSGVSSAAANFIGQKTVISDTATGLASTIQGLVIDESGSSNTSAAYNGIEIDLPSGASSNNNLLLFKNGSNNVFKVNNAGGTLITTSTNLASALQVNATNATNNVFQVSTNGNYLQVGNIVSLNGGSGSGGLAGIIKIADGSTTGRYVQLQTAGSLTNSVDTITLPDETGTVCTSAATSAATCTNFAAAPTSGSYLQQVPATTAANTVTPTAAGVIGLTVNGTSGTAATAASIVQGGAALALNITSSSTGDGADINLTNTSGGSTTNGLFINRNGTGGTTNNGINITNTLGTLNNGISINQAGGTLTTGLAFSGTITTDISRASGTLTLQGGGGVNISTPASTSVSTSGITIQSGSATVGSNLTAGTVTVDTGTRTGTGTAILTLGSTNAQAINIGASNTNSSTIQIGGSAVSTGTQTINIANTNTAGGTTNVNIGTGSSAAGGTTTVLGKTAVTITANGASTWSTTSGLLTIQGGGGLTLNTPDSTTATTSAVSLKSGNASSGSNLTAGTVTVDTGTHTGTGTGTLNLGNANATAIQIGSASSTNTVTGATSIAGGNVQINNSTGSNTVQISNGSSTGAISIGNSASGTLAIQGGASSTIVINNGGGNTTTLNFTAPSSANTITFPAASGTVQLTPASGSYIKQVPATTGDNTIAPTAASVVALTVKGTTNATTAHVLDIYNANASPTLQAFFDAAGSLNVSQLIQPTANNTVDLGTSSAAFRTGYFGTSVVTPAVTSNGATALGIDTGAAGSAAITLGATNATTINVGSITSATLTQSVNIGTNNTAGSTTNVTVGSGSSATGGTTTVQAKAAVNITAGASSTWSTSSGTLTIQGNGGVTVNTPGSTSVSTSGITIQSGSATVGTNLTAGTVAIDTGTQTGTGTAILNLGAGNAKTIQIGNAGTATAITGTLTASGGNIQLNNSTGSSTVQISSGTSTGAISIGNSASGTLAIQGGASSTIVINNGGGNTTTLNFTAPSSANTITFPAASGTVQLAPASGSYIKQVPATTADNTISPTATGVVGLSIKGPNTSTAHLLDIYNSATSPVLQDYFDSAGILNVGQIIQPTANNTIDLATSTTGFRTGYFATSVVSPAFTSNGATALGIDTGAAGAAAITLGATNATTINLGSITSATLTQAVNVGTNNTAGSTTNVTIGSGSSATGGTTTVQAKAAVNITAGASSTWSTSAGTLTIQGNGGVNMNTPGSTTVSTAGITIQSGSATVGTNLTAGTVAIDTGTQTGSGTAILNLGAANAKTIQIGNASSTTAVTSTNFNLSTAGVVTLAGNQAADITTPSAATAKNITIQPGTPSSNGVVGATTTINGGTGTTTGDGGLTKIQGGAGGNGAAASGGGATIQGGAGNGSSASNGGTVTLQGGAAGTGGIKGLIQLNGATYFTSVAYSSGSNSTITQSSIDSNSSILATATTTGLTFTVPSPTAAGSLSGRILYLTNAGTNPFTLAGAGTSFTLNAGSTATLVWNAASSVWTTAGADISTLQNAYGNSTGATTPEIILDATRNGLDIQDKTGGTIGATQGLLNVRGVGTTTTLGASLFTVNGSGQVGINNGSTLATATISYDLSFGQGANRTIGVETQATAATPGNDLTMSAGTGNTTGSGGQVKLQGGTSGNGASASGGAALIQGGTGNGSSASNGGTVTLQGGTAGTGGIKGLIQLNGATYFTTGTYSTAVSATITQSVVDSNSAILATATAGSVTLLVPSPSAAGSVSGRVLYITNAGFIAFNLSFSTTNFTLNPGSTATLIWNAASSIWTTAGADISTLQSSYNNSLGGTVPDVLLDSAHLGIDIQDANLTIGNTQSLLSVRGSATPITLGASLFVVNGSGKVGIGNGGTTATPTLSYDLSFGQGANRTIGVETQGSTATPGNDLTLSAGTGNTTGGGGQVKLQGGASGNGAAASGGAALIQGGTGNGSSASNGGTVTLQGGTAGTGGIKGLIQLNGATYFTAGTYSSGSTSTITQSVVDSNSSILATATATSLTFTVPSPSAAGSFSGRILYITNAGTNPFTLSFSTTSFTLNPGSTATLIWNAAGSVWTGAGADASTMQNVYNNSVGGTTPEILLDSTRNGIDIQDANPTIGNTQALLSVRASATATTLGASLFVVNSVGKVGISNGGTTATPTLSYDLSFGQGANRTIGVETQGTTATPGNDLSLSAGTGNTSGTGGQITLQGGSGGNAGAGGIARVLGGNAGGSNTAGGEVKITGGTASGTGAGGAITIQGGLAAATAGSTGGAITIASGLGTSTGTGGAGSNITLNAGNAGGSGNNNGGNVIALLGSSTGTGTQGSFQVQNALGASLLTVDPTNTAASLNLIANGGAETGSPPTSWAAQGTGSSVATGTGSDAASGSQSGKITFGTSSNAGVKIGFTTAPTASTTVNYIVSFSAKQVSGTAMSNSLQVLYSPDNGTTLTPTCSNYSTQALSTTAWTKITCTFIPGSTTVTTALLIVRQTDAPGVSRVIDIDNVSVVQQNSSGTGNTGDLRVGGVLSQGLTLLTLDSYAGAPFTGANATLAGSMYYDTTSDKIQCYDGTNWGACGAAPNTIVSLTPEYTGAVLDAAGAASSIGTMTSDFCANQSSISFTVNTSLCATGEARNFYKWTSPQATQQSYSIFVTYKLPSTFNNFLTNTITLTGRSDNVTNGIVTYQVYQSSGAAITACGTETDVTTASGANVWHVQALNTDPAGCSFVAGNNVIFKINVKAQSNANVYVENLNFTFTNK